MFPACQLLAQKNRKTEKNVCPTLDVNRISIVQVLWRSLRLRCPACGQASIARSAFRLRHHCPNCRSLFKREEGFFVGAILANVLTTEFVILAVCFVWLLLIGSSYESVLAGLIVVALIFPVAFYHHSWSLWLGFDYLVEGLPKI
ncbi:MAG: DUF983 domain-containing protein [Pyrinomonadaceae bacterium]